MRGEVSRRRRDGLTEVAADTLDQLAPSEGHVTPSEIAMEEGKADAKHDAEHDADVLVLGRVQTNSSCHA